MPRPLDWLFTAVKGPINAQQVCMHYSTPPAEGDLDFSVPGFDCFGQRDIGQHVVSGVLNVIAWVGLALELL